MRNKYFVYLLLMFLILLGFQSFGQDRFDELSNELVELSDKMPALNEKIDISVTGVTLQQFVRGIANNVGINVNVDPSLDIKVMNNFTQVSVSDILLFLCKEYDLDISLIGNIISISKYVHPEPPKIVKKPKEIKVDYDPGQDLLSIDLDKDTLSRVIKAITDKSGKNIIIAPDLGNEIVSGYIQRMPFDNVLEKFAFANKMVVNKTADNFYVLEKEIVVEDNSKTGNKIKKTGNRSKFASANKSNEYELEVNDFSDISIIALDVPILNIINQVSDELKIDHNLLTEIDQNTSIIVTHVGYDDLLFHLLKGTDYTYNKVKNVYFFGEKKNTDLNTTRVIQLKNRTVEKILEFLPKGVIKDLEITEFLEQNSLIASGSLIEITELENFIRDIDKVVPVILIDILIVDVQKSYSISTGISAGVGENPDPSSQSVYPGIDYDLSTESLNNLINSFNDFGWIKLGQVSPDFYLSIKALEDNGALKIRSTPKLSTLSGHEAVLTSGETKYYKEEKSNYIGSQNPSLSSSYTWTAINADLSVTIKPIVSSDDQVTLFIDVTQSQFTPREFEDSPPGAVNRTFQSQIRVKNQEMILLGGLEKNTMQESSRGLPLIARIPVLKWIFASRTKSKSDTKLNIFIQPTIIY